MPEQRGPYVNEANDEFYLPAFDWPFNAARSEIASHVEGTHGPWARTRYEGKRNVQIHDHDEPWDEDNDCPWLQCWTFTVYEGTYRR